jgi:hypothetical protein
VEDIQSPEIDELSKNEARIVNISWAVVSGWMRTKSKRPNDKWKAQTGSGDVTSESTHKRLHNPLIWGIPLITVAGLICLALMPIRVHRTFDDTDRLVADLQAPKSADQLFASLAMVRSQIGVSHSEGQESAHWWRMLKLSGALLQVLQANPELPEAWQTAGSMIASRSVPNGPIPSEICGKLSKGESKSSDLTSVDHGDLTKYSNCTIVLDDAPQIVNSNQLFSKQQLEKYAHGLRRPTLQLQNVHVIYRSGEILPVDAIACVDCTFEFEIRTPPSPRGRSLIRALLVAADIDNVGVELSEPVVRK